jgi:hypothetical protein
MRASLVQRTVVVVVATLALLLLALPAGANPGSPGPLPRTGANTDLVMTGTGPGQGVSGGIAPAGDTAFDPLGGYPSTIPAGFEPLNEGFAGVITAQAQLSGEQLEMFCIDIRTSTYPGLGYQNSSWDDSNVPNVGFVAYILNHYFPNTTEPAGAPNDNVRGAAVQAAIWFLTDKYVLAPGDPVRPFTEAIVADAIANGPLQEPPPPDLTIDPASQRGAADTPLGPYVVSGDTAPTVTVSATDATMFADAAATVPIANDASVPSGQQIWLLPTTPGGASTATLSARSVATVPSGNVYVYDGNTTGVNDSQRLILAHDAVIAAFVQAQAEFFDTGSLVVGKTIGGSAAGQQGEIVIQVTCNGVALPDFVIPAGTTEPPPQTATYDNIETPATCTVTETSDGGGGAVTVVTVNGSQTVDLAENTTSNDPVEAEPILNTYEPAPGSLVVTKTITGSAAGQQGDVTLHVSCDNGLEQDIVIPAGATGDTSTTIDDLPAGTVCTVTETADGSTSTAVVTIDSTGSPATIAPGADTGVQVTDTYQPPPGSLVVTKTITGSAAGDQGDVTLHVSCDNGLEQDIVIAAGATGDTSTTVGDLPAGTVCAVTEPADGATSAVLASVVITGNPATISAAGETTVLVTDTYEPAAGSLVLTKTITGFAAGHQGGLTLNISCTNGLEQGFVVPPGSTGDAVWTIPNLAAGTTCTVTEPANGSSTSVGVSMTGLGAATVAAGVSAALHVTDSYDFIPTPAVAPVSSVLPNTGQPVAEMVWVSVLLLALGIAALLAARRRSAR